MFCFFKFLILLVIIPDGFGTELTKVLFDEGQISNFIKAEPPTLQQIEASYLDNQLEAYKIQDQLGFRLEGDGSLYRSKERLLNNFDGGVTARSTQYSLGIVKPTRYGMNLGVKSFGGKVTNAFVSDAASAGMGVQLSLDLFKDFLGRKTNSSLKKSEFSMKRAELEKKLGIKTFETNLRKIYWNLVALEEQRKLLDSLVNSAEIQYKESELRRKSGVADIGEVARYRSQWASRKSSLLSLRYQKGELVKTLKELLPELNGKEIYIGKYDVDKTILEVLTCSEKIRSYKEAPKEFTPYDEIVQYLEQEENYERKIDDTYDSPEVKLIGEFSNVGRGFGFDSARNDYSDDARSRTSLGVQVSIPLGGRKNETEIIKRKISNNNYKSKIRSRESKINAFHTETADIIKILKEVVGNQKETNHFLEKSLIISKKKYEQARISVQELISEQDSHLQSKLSEIDTNLTIIITLMDYFSVYTDFPCELNGVRK